MLALEKWLFNGFGMTFWGLLFVVVFCWISRRYIEGYLKEKGKNLATVEDYSKLREELKQTTQDTEEIKQVLAGKGWLAQQRWARKEKYVVDLVVALEKVYRTGKILEDCRDKRIAGTLLDEMKRDDSIKNDLAELDAAIAQLISSAAVARIYLSNGFLIPIASLIDEFKEGRAVNIADGTLQFYSYYSNWCNAAKDVLESVIKDAQDELRSFERH